MTFFIHMHPCILVLFDSAEAPPLSSSSPHMVPRFGKMFNILKSSRKYKRLIHWLHLTSVRMALVKNTNAADNMKTDPYSLLVEV